MSTSPTILKAFDAYDDSASTGAVYQGPVNDSTIYAPVSVIHYCDSGDVWLGKGWYARRKPTKTCQARITAHDGKLSVAIPRTLFARMRYSYSLNVQDIWKIEDFRFIKGW